MLVARFGQEVSDPGLPDGEGSKTSGLSRAAIYIER